MTIWYVSPSSIPDIEQILEHDVDVDVTLEKHKSHAFIGGERIYPWDEEYEQRLPDSTYYIPVKGYLYGSYYNHIVNSIYKGQDARLIFMDIDTLGGEASGLQSITALMRESKTRIIGYTSGHCCSAGYFIASNCYKMYASGDARIGSVGSMGHFKKRNGPMFENEYEGTVVSRRAPKKLPDKQDTQEMSNRYEDIFYDEISLGRKVDHDFIEKNFGQGGTMLGEEALESRMIDGVMHRHVISEQVGLLPSLNSTGSEENDETFFNELNSINGRGKTMSKEQNGAPNQGGTSSAAAPQGTATNGQPAGTQLTPEQVQQNAMNAVFERISQVENSGEYQGREKLAKRLIKTTMSVDDIVATLADAPRETAAPQGGVENNAGQGQAGNQNNGQSVSTVAHGTAAPQGGVSGVPAGQNPLDALYSREGGGPQVGVGQDSTESVLEQQNLNGGFAPSGHQNSQSGVGSQQSTIIQDPLYALLDLNPNLTAEEKQTMVMNCRANERAHGVPSDSLSGSLDDRTDLLNIGNG